MRKEKEYEKNQEKNIRKEGEERILIKENQKRVKNYQRKQEKEERLDRGRKLIDNTKRTFFIGEDKTQKTKNIVNVSCTLYGGARRLVYQVPSRHYYYYYYPTKFYHLRKTYDKRIRISKCQIIEKL